MAQCVACARLHESILSTRLRSVISLPGALRRLISQSCGSSFVRNFFFLWTKPWNLLVFSVVVAERHRSKFRLRRHNMPNNVRWLTVQIVDFEKYRKCARKSAIRSAFGVSLFPNSQTTHKQSRSHRHCRNRRWQSIACCRSCRVRRPAASNQTATVRSITSLSSRVSPLSQSRFNKYQYKSKTT